MPEWLTPEEVADELRVTRRAVYKWLNTGALKGAKAGHVWRIRREDLEAFLDLNGRNGHDEPTAEELAESEQAWRDYLAGRDPGKTLDEVRRELETRRG